MENRYDKYKDSGVEWIGEIPVHWEIIKIKNAFYIISGATPKTDNMAYWDGEITWITPADYNTEDKIISSGKRNITLAGLNSCGTSIVPEGSIIFSKRAPIGLVAINVVPLCTNQGCISCIPKPSVNTKYFYYLMSVLTDWFELFGSGTTFKELSTNNFANFILSQPPISEQQFIAAYLDQKCDEIDELITLQEEMITKLQSYKQSVITEAVTKGLDKNVPLKDSGIEWIGEIPKHWIVKRLKFSCNIWGRIGFRGYKSDDLVPEGEGAITLSPSNMKDMKMDYTNRTYLSWKKYYESPEIMISNNDILMVKTGSTYGKCSFVENMPMECTINPQIVVFKQHKDNPKFLAYSFQTRITRAFVETSVVGGTIPTIAQEKIMNYFFAFPPLSEQQSIADYLDQKCSEIDELISIKQRKIEKLKEYKKSLIFECVTGKRKVC